MTEITYYNQKEQLEERSVSVESIARLYSRVFADEPWNEANICPCCMSFSGVETVPGDSCQNTGCNGILEEAYPLERTMQYINEDMDRPESVLYIASVEDRVVGFSWGYRTTKEDFLRRKCRTSEKRELVGSILDANLVDDEFYYLSECGIDSNVRGKGLGKRLSYKVFQYGPSLGTPVVVGTNCKSPMVGILQSFGMEQVMGQSVVFDKVKRELCYDGRVVNGLDSDNPDRVLFISR